MRSLSILFVGPMLGKHWGRIPNPAEELASHLLQQHHRCRLTSSHLNRYLRFFEILYSIVRLRKEVDIISLQVYGGRSFIVEDAASWLARFLRLRVVMVLHGGDMPRFMHRFPKWSHRVLSRAHSIVTPSAFLANELLPYGFRAKIIPNGIDLNLYPNRTRQSVRPKMLWMRAFHEIYNPQMAAETLRHLVSLYPDATLTMAGQDDGLLEAVRALTFEKKIQERVRFVGFLDASAKRREFALHDIFIHTNRVDNMPISLIEASAFGLPIVATSVGGVPYLVHDRENGVLVPPDDSAAMAVAIRCLVEEPELAERLSRNARTVGENHDWAVILPQWESLFQSVADLESS
jgi:glycosyltransferase involved in cell wall biosynthesis